ncbi:Metal-dependent hydrolase [Croceitalea dokdonensis DOKDO 023]|uniref:Metal-dependent hydrolase n=1 Tax=Croceitalea dokdonensis DOKDO 023 TaxID=1300341 RepID=A0A0P7AV50_9FLAO|nr:metal-dependent hydrolase [Croceitalea dokdonensis]KPM31733.1 Metal-dependent hydrolase [Croceitalea dokdonensis DOKDO 023]
MEITFLGHASFLIEIQGKRLIVDPFITANELAKSVAVESLKADYILLTHGHQDHILDVETIVSNNPNCLLIANYELVEWFGKKGILGHPLNHGGKKLFDFGMLKFVNAIHSSMLPDGSYGGNPGGFVLSNQQHCIYIAGDTALSLDMQLIPKTCPSLDIAILPIGDNFTMGYEDALLAANFVQCNQVIGCHYDTFPPIQLDKEKAIRYFKENGKQLLLPNIGETIKL